MDLTLAVEIINFLLGLVATVLGIAAIRFAVTQKGDAKKTLDAIEEALKKLDDAARVINDAARQLPTRYVGAFPGNMQEIVSVLSAAQREVVILADFAGYGSYSNPQLFFQYKNLLEDAVHRNPAVSVKLYAYGPQLRERTLRAEFGKLSPFDASASDHSKALLAEFTAMMLSRGVKVSNLESFIQALIAEERKCLNDFRGDRISCFELKSTAPFFLWMVDRRECVFSFENEPEKQNYFAFRTRDTRLLEYFQSYVDSVHPESTPYEIQN